MRTLTAQSQANWRPCSTSDELISEQLPAIDVHAELACRSVVDAGRPCTQSPVMCSVSRRYLLRGSGTWPPLFPQPNLRPITDNQGMRPPASEHRLPAIPDRRQTRSKTPRTWAFQPRLKVPVRGVFAQSQRPVTREPQGNAVSKARRKPDLGLGGAVETVLLALVICYARTWSRQVESDIAHG